MGTGHVYLVGSGPGDPELLTLKAMRLIAQADVVVYDRLVSLEILDFIPAGALRIDVGKRAGHHPVPQHEINALLVKLGQAGHRVVRLKGGDPFIFGRGSEEGAELARAGIAYSVVPGITSAQGCAAAARVPLTHRGLATGVRYLTGHCRADQPLDLDWDSLADPDTTLVVYMGLQTIANIARELTARGIDAATPVLAVCQGTTPRERRIITRLDRLESAATTAAFDGPVLFIIGRVVTLATETALVCEDRHHETPRHRTSVPASRLAAHA
jgi:uroporphyrin-III C-methyltransferase